MNSMPRGAYSSHGSVFDMQEQRPSGYKKYSMQNFTPEQIDLFSQLFSLVGPESQTGRLASGDQSMFDQIEAPALRQFNELQGGLASRFSGMGGLGARKSSGFQNASNAAAQDFAGQLQANRQGLQRQAILDLMGLSESLLGQRPFTQGFAEKRQKDNSGFMNFLGEMAGAIPGYFTGGSKGAAKGASNTFNSLGGF